MQVPEGGVHMVAVADQRDDGHPEQLAQLAQRGREHGCGAAERVARFGVDDGDIAVFDHPLQLADQGNVAGELSLADASDVPQQLLAADEPVDGDHVVGAVRENGFGCDLEIHEGVVVAQEQIRRLQVFGARFGEDVPVFDHIRHAQDPFQRLEIPFGRHRGPFHIKAGEVLSHGRSSLSAGRRFSFIHGASGKAVFGKGFPCFGGPVTGRSYVCDIYIVFPHFCQVKNMGAAFVPTPIREFLIPVRQA